MTPAEFKTWRTRSKLTQSQAAEMLGISARSIGTYEQPDNVVPRVVALAVGMLGSRISISDMPDLWGMLHNQVQEQHPILGANIVLVGYAMPQQKVGGKRFHFWNVLRTNLTDEVRDWMATNTPTGKFSAPLVILPDQTPCTAHVVAFETEREMSLFLTRYE